MKQCEWCGLLSSDGNVCSWCKHAFPDGTVPHGVELRQRSLAPYIACGVLFVLLVAITASMQVRAASADPIVATPAVYAPTPPLRMNRTNSHLLTPKAKPTIVTAETSTPNRSRPSPQSAPALVSNENVPTAEDALADVPSPQMSVGSATFGYRESDEGQQMAAGTIVVTNEGNVNLSDFRFSMLIDGVSYRLLPFNGSLANPRNLGDISVEPGQSLSIPVIMQRPFTPSEEAQKVVTIQARGESGGSVSETVDVP